jgi:hypothetical protein
MYSRSAAKVSRHDEDQHGTDNVMGRPGGQRQQPGQGLTIAK